MKKVVKNIMVVCMTIILIVTLLPEAGSVAQGKANKKVLVKQINITSPTTDTIVLKKGKTYQLKTKVTPSNASNKTVSFTSSNSKIVLVNTTGKLEAIKAGTVKITVATKDGSKKKTVLTVKVGSPVTKVMLNQKSLTKKVGESVTLKATISPSSATVKSVTYSSSNTTLATVSNKGIVTLKKAGTVTITATANDGSKKNGVCTIIIKKVESKSKITPTTTPKLTPKATLTPEPSPTVTTTPGSNLGTTPTQQPTQTPQTPQPTPQATPTVSPSPTNTPSTPTPIPTATPGTDITPTPIEQDPYSLVWEDDFEGDSLNTSIWNYETHEPGWVNNELQAYTDSTDNIYVKDGALVLKAIKSVSDNTSSYTSGKVNTKNKQDVKYGKFEVRAKVPEGQGLWPAIWMMPTDEMLYGQWPKCGEIDIMEILGHETNKLYGTVHYGIPHEESQGSYTLTTGSFADDYHVFGCEWEPGEFRFYIDGNLYHTVNRWFTKEEGKEAVTYPAPFDQPFFMQLNLAVGGNWPGNPNETTDFDNAEFKIDYVKVYQLDSYDENVVEPPIELRNPDAHGNYIVNGDFAAAEDFLDTINWRLLTAGGGVASASITTNNTSEHSVSIISTNPGNVDYGVQLVQAGLPMKRGGNYELTFDAMATENRTMIVDVSAPDKNYKRYLADTLLNLTTEKQSYQYTFTVMDGNDANGRLEFNLGNQGSIGGVEISNIKLVKVSQTDIIDDTTKTILPDGNYVYNGEFQEGASRLSYWEIVNNCQAAIIHVTNIDNIRELKVVVPDNVSDIGDIIVKQPELAIGTDKKYALSFDAYGTEAKTIQVTMNGIVFDVPITTTKMNYQYSFETSDTLINRDLVFILGVAGTTFIDNVRIVDDGLLVNGDFSNGLIGYEVFADGAISQKVSYAVNSLTENSAAEIAIQDTGAQDWQIQLKQNNITLEKDKWYKIKLEAKSDIGRQIMYALQKDGNLDNDWTAYSSTKFITLTDSYQTFETVFKMNSDTDKHVILSISMGAVGGTRITTAHKVWIDNITLEETTEPVIIVDDGTNLIQNGDFANADDKWIAAITAPGVAEYSFTNNALFNITNVGTADWNIQLKQSGLTLEKDVVYRVTMKVTSTESRTVKVVLLSTTYAYYGGVDVALEENVTKEISHDITMTSATDTAADFIVSMGLIDGISTPASTVTIDDISIVKLPKE